MFVAWVVKGNDFVNGHEDVAGHIGIGIFIDGNGCCGMGHIEHTQTTLYATLGDVVLDAICNGHQFVAFVGLNGEGMHNLKLRLVGRLCQGGCCDC